VIASKSDFVLEWDKALGFRADPFADKIFGPINSFLVDRKEEKEKINWFFIKNYFYGAIIGEPGVGKTIMLKWLEDRLGKYNRIHAVYINAAVFKEQVNIIQKMIMPLLSFPERYITKPHNKLLSADFVGFLEKKLEHKTVALLIDNAHYLTEKNLELIKSLKKEGLKLKIIITSNPKEYERSRLPEIGHDELGITLRRPTYEEAKEMIKLRIQAFGGRGTYPFTDEELKALYERADKNPKEFLKLCRDEAIKILIHKREMLDKQAYVSKPESKPLKTSFKKMPGVDDKMDVKIRKATENEVEEEKKEDKKKLIRIRFAFGKEKEKPRKQAQPSIPVKKDDTSKQKLAEPEIQKSGISESKTEGLGKQSFSDKKAIFDDEHKQELVNRLSSTSPRRQPVKPEAEKGKKDKEYMSETDKLLRELAEEFEVE
jgi:type II secretory pathway predicted ATPase ExeA